MAGAELAGDERAVGAATGAGGRRRCAIHFITLALDPRCSRPLHVRRGDQSARRALFGRAWCRGPTGGAVSTFVFSRPRALYLRFRAAATRHGPATAAARRLGYQHSVCSRLSGTSFPPSSAGCLVRQGCAWLPSLRQKVVDTPPSLAGYDICMHTSTDIALRNCARRYMTPSQHPSLSSLFGPHPVRPPFHLSQASLQPHALHRT